MDVMKCKNASSFFDKIEFSFGGQDVAVQFQPTEAFNWSAEVKDRRLIMTQSLFEEI